MNNNAQSIKSFISSLTPLSWVLILALLGGIVFGAFYMLGDSKTTAQPILDESSGLVQNSNELPPVTEGDGKTGEILPPASTAPKPKADITSDNINFPQ